MSRRILLFIASMLFMLPMFAQQYLTGKVVADDDGLPLVGATAWFEENPAAKVRVGDNGTFRIRFRQGNLIIHCFGFNDAKVNIRRASNISVRLKPESSQMQEVVVEAKKKKYTRKGNPAVEMMQKVIDARKSTDIKQNDYVTFEKYQRTMIALNDYDSTSIEDENLKKKTKVLASFAEMCPETGKIIVPISIEEKNSTEYFVKDGNKNKSVVHGMHSESLLDLLSFSELLETKFKDNLKEVNIYDNEVVLLEHNFISPIGGAAAIRFYHYAIADTTYEDGDKCYKMVFSPANPSDIGFSGSLYIMADSTWRVKRAKFGVPVASNINFIKTMDVDQEYESLENGAQICCKNRMMMQLKLTSYIKQLYVDYNVQYRDWAFNPIEDKTINFLGEEKIEKGAKLRNNDYWAQARPDTLTHAQANVAEMKRRFVDRPVVKAIIYGMRIILDNYLETSTDPNKPSKVIIGPFFSLVGQNFVEGFHLRLGAQTTGALNKHWFFKTWIKYGFGDKKVKGEGTVIYSFNEKEKTVNAWPIRTLSFSYCNDIQSPGDKFLEFNRDNAFMSIAWNNTRFMSYFERFRLQFEWEFNNGLHINTVLNRETDKGVGNMFYRTIKDWNEGKVVKDPSGQGKVHYTELQLWAEYQPGVKYLNTKSQRYLANREAPIYGISHTVGLFDNANNSTKYVYNYTDLTLKKRFWLKSWGSIDAFHCASFQWNKVPFNLLCLPRSNFSFIRSENTFALIENMEFLNDRTFSMMYRWDLNGKILNRIPLIKKLKWREAIGFNLMWGYLTSKNNPYSAPADDNYLYRFPGKWINGEYCSTTQIMNSWKPYAEVSVGIHNIWKFFSFDYYHRLTYVKSGTQTWGLRFAFQASF